MIVSRLIKNLEKFPDDLEVIISDVYNLNSYSLDKASFLIFEKQLDIGVGGCEIEFE